MTVTNHGPCNVTLKFDNEGYRTYNVKFKVETDDPADFPQSILTKCPGLVPVGSNWIIGNDLDVWVWRSPETSVEPFEGEEPSQYWWINLTFTNKPPDPKKQRCNDTQIEDPVLEPPRISIKSEKRFEEATNDRFGKALKNSSHEQLRGQQVEFMTGGSQIEIEMKVLQPSFPLLDKLKYTVNDSVMWGFPARCVLFVGYNAEKLYYGLCYAYWKINLEFQVYVKVDPKTGAISSGWDRDILDQGHKVLNGAWGPDPPGKWVLKNINGNPPDPTNPAHFITAIDRKKNPMSIILDGKGKPYDPEIPKITTCAECPDGAMAQWQVSGLQDSIDGIGTPKLDYTSGCGWTKTVTTVDGNTYTLTLTLTNISSKTAGTLTVTRAPVPPFGGGTVTFKTDTSAGFDPFDCLGENVLFKEFDPVPPFDCPDSISIVPVGLTDPGMIHVEYYPETNLFLTGVPAIL